MMYNKMLKETLRVHEADANTPDTYTMSDQPEQCRKCGARTDFKEEGGKQVHKCPGCGYSYHVVKEAEGDLGPQEQALVMELSGLQKKIKDLEAKLLELKDTRKDLSAPVIAAMQKLELQNVRVGKILVSLVKGGAAAPSFNMVMDAVRQYLEPAVTKLLDDTYAKIGTQKEPYLKIKNEAAGDMWSGIKDFFVRGFEQLVGGVSSALDKIESAMGIAAVPAAEKVTEGTGEKRCSDCGWEFYEADKGKCPECGSKDWEHKLVGKAPEKSGGKQ
jgi:predicted Zn-ribbon and HTH transcriptional regulator